MKKFLKESFSIFIIWATSLVMFFPSLFVFFTNDDFFHLKIAQIHNFSDFLKFFYVSPEGWGLYRPIGTQVFYAIGTYIFKLQPYWMHIVLFALFFIIIYLVKRIMFELAENKHVSFVAAFLYATSATHFGQLYFLATQELWVGIFYLASILWFLIYLKKPSIWLFMLSLIAFVFALMSKETAVTLPLVLVLIYWFKKGAHELKTIAKLSIPYWAILLVYAAFRIKFYGFTSGESYVWDFSVRLFNTLGWYGLWSLNIPEMLIDFVGPGLKLNPNLLLYWGSQFRAIFSLFGLSILAIMVAFVFKSKTFKKDLKIYTFGILWFVVTLLPVLFLPLHKFSFYLTIPLSGIVLMLGQLFSKQKILVLLFSVFWVFASVFTLRITRETNWITQGELVSQRVYEYFSKNRTNLINKHIVFVDTPSDIGLPWSPTTVIRQALSDSNFFYVYFPELAKNISYSSGTGYTVESRQFLGY